jgi:hypothetical protein
MTYGKAPDILGRIDVALPEVMYYLYLPISLRGQVGMYVPTPLRPLKPLIRAVQNNLGTTAWQDNYIYITVKKMFCSPSVTANRPGWHADGFGTDDLNYVWYDSLPTEFCTGPFKITEGDHVKSLQEFEDQAGNYLDFKLVTYPCNTLLRLDSKVVHRVAMATEQIMRTFVKISVSKDQYNLKDNSINHDLSYSWQQHDRDAVRNNPSTAQADSYKIVQDDHFV